MRLGVPELFEFQKLAVRAALAKRDSFLVIPTGGGKSFCYIIPALTQPGLVLVVSPLIALMRDQQRQLSELGIPSQTLDSLLSPEEKRQVREQIFRRQLKLLFVSPERLALPGFREMLSNVPLALVAIDEAHCVHEWGLGFRPEYRRLGSYLDELEPAPRMALTATLTGRERAGIIESLRMREPELIVRPAPRQNLELQVQRHRKVEDQRQHLVESVEGEQGRSIVYAATRKNVEEIHRMFIGRGLPASLYHGGLRAKQRIAEQEAFVSGKKRVIVASKAFGMGIHLPDVRMVVHANMPCSLESYTQEVGRAGRDGLLARCTLHYGPRDYFVQKFLIDKSYPSESDALKIYEGLDHYFQKRASYREDELMQKLGNFTDLESEAVINALAFFYRENIYQLSDVHEDGAPFWESFVVPGARNVSFDKLLQALQEQVAWRYDKLNAMHRLVKQGGCPRQYIEQYFV